VKLGHVQQVKNLESERLPLEYVWRECFDYTYPILGAGLQQTSETLGALSDASTKKVNKLYDSTAAEACRLLASALLSGLTPANVRWFALEAVTRGIRDERLNRWLDEAADATWQAIHEGNYDSVGMEIILSWVIGGWGAMYMDVADDDSLRFTAWPMHECYLSQTSASGPVDRVYRKFRLTRLQAQMLYPDNPPNSWKNHSPDKMLDFLWVIEPRRVTRDGQAASGVGKAMPIASYHYEMAGKTLLRESGFRAHPVIVPRWLPLPNSPYAVGPMYEALADTKTLNEVVRFVLMNADLATAGMWIAEDDGVLNPRTVRIGPRQVVVANSTDSLKPLRPATDFQVSFVEMENLQRAVRRMLMADQLQLPSNVEMTATEVTARLEQLRQLLAPILGRLQSEFLQPMIVRAVTLLVETGQIAPPPVDIGSLNIRYVSPLARAQRAADVNVMDRFEMDLLNTAQAAQDPSVLDLYDFEGAKKEKSRLLGVPQKLIRTPAQVQKIREARQQAQQQAMAQQQQADETDEMTQRLLKRELASGG
jgi:hypothetical protein